MSDTIKFIAAGLGPLEVPASAEAIMERLGEEISREGGWLRSDHSPGSIAFEKGALGSTILYLPYPNWNNDPENYHTKNIVTISDSRGQDNIESAIDHVQEYCNKKSLGKLSEFDVYNLARMYLIIMGTNENPVDILLYWKPKKKKRKKNLTEEELEEIQKKEEELEEEQRKYGNVDIAVKIAEDYDITTINLADKFYKINCDSIMNYINCIMDRKRDIVRETRELISQ